MTGNLFTAVTIRRRSAAHGYATAHPDARSAGGGQDDQVDVDFGQDSERFTGDYGADIERIISYFTPFQHLVAAL